MIKFQSRLNLIILFLLPVYLIKLKLGWLSFNLLELLIGFLFLLWIFSKNTKYQIPNTKYILPVSLIIIGLILSVLANKDYYTGFGAIKGWFLFPLIFGIIFYDALRKDDSLLKKSMLALFFSGAVVSAIGIVYKILGVVTFDDRLKIFWDSPNQLAMFLAVPFLVGVNLVISRLSLGNFPRLSLIISSVLIAINLFLTKSYGAWIALLVALIVIYWLKYRDILQKKYTVLFAIIFLAVFGLASVSKYNSIKTSSDRSSLASRFTIWKSAGLMIENNPLFGIGPGNFQNKYLEYQKYFPPYLEWSVPQPHSIFLAFWLESGIVGLVGFVILLFYYFWENKIAIRNNRDAGVFLLGIMIYILIHGLIDTTYWRNDLAVVFWMAVAMNIFLAKAKNKSSA